MRHRSSSRRWSRFVAGLLLALLGILFWLDQQGRFDIGSVGDWWPLILIAIGVGKLVEHRRRGTVGGLVLTSVGVLFLLDEVWRIDVEDTWPLVLVALGLGLAWQAVVPKTPEESSSRSAPPPPPPPGALR